MGKLLDDIKNAANKNKTAIQTTEELNLEKILNKMFYVEKNIEEETKFVKHIMTRGQEHQERVGMHASAILVSDKDFCVRQQVLSLIYKQKQGEQVAVGLKRIFEEGNAIHEKWQRLFIRSGYAKYNDCDFTNYSKEYMLTYTPDIIANIPAWYDEDFVVEIKSVNTMQFKKSFIKDGKKHPSAGKQCQWYMFHKGLKKGVVLNEDKNDQSFNVEVHNYNEAIIAPYIERLEEVKFHYNNVLSKRKMVNRPDNATSYDCKRCANCMMVDSCWGVGKGKVKIK